jgi:hypothetical protein
MKLWKCLTHAVCTLSTGVFASLIVTSPSNSALVKVDANFQSFRMGAFNSAESIVRNGLAVNGIAVDVCSGDASCANAFTNPLNTVVPISGINVLFGYNANQTSFSPVMNSFAFTSSFEQVNGFGPLNKFRLGNISFTNGQFYPLAFIQIGFSTVSNDSLYNGKSLQASVVLDTNSVPPPRDPFEEADYFTVQDSTGVVSTDLGSVRVFDNFACPPGTPVGQSCNTGSVDVFGYLTNQQTLQISGFGNATGGAFTNPSVGTILSPVPEPENVVMMLVGLSMLAAAHLRKSRRSHSQNGYRKSLHE